ncbi:hypothetical protein [Legionella shakespearei]|uniref:J domain-containing protein n=1 Tax=Legionella shakespearei DSM 23087 TaxID=1122169 RepID=A0A0W0YLP4_9GAMM|nr:hypothetical protein [Legionella shakespearei]KTD57852.1 hypothetical protein Lsha_2237 [Legionella shakespearei DSM 23087]
MPYVYNSIFDGSSIVTKADMCAILNLDPLRPGLSFSAAEINKAYKLRALRLHPDSQNRHSDHALPKEVCEAAFNDAVLAKTYLLNGEDNIPGKALKEKLNSLESEDFIDLIINTLNGIKEGSQTISETVNWVYWLSSGLLVTVLLSTYSDSDLNLRYVNEFSELLTTLRPYLQGIDGTAVASFLKLLRETIGTAEELNSDELIAQIKLISPELLDSLVTADKLDALILALKESGQALKTILTDDFIDQVQHIVSFWPQLLANLPTWKQLIGVYFVSLLFTATSLPKYFNALKVISETIIQQKGILPFLIAALPMYLVSALLLPVNITLQLAIPLAWIALKAAYQLVTNSFLVVFATINLFTSLLPGANNSFKTAALDLFEGVFNLTIRLPLNIGIELLDSVLFILCNKNPLSPLQEWINELFDSLFGILHPENGLELDQGGESFALEIYEEPALPEKEAPNNAKPDQNFGFFPNAKFLDEKDPWLNDLLNNIAATETAEHHSQYAA